MEPSFVPSFSVLHTDKQEGVRDKITYVTLKVEYDRHVTNLLRYLYNLMDIPAGFTPKSEGFQHIDFPKTSKLEHFSLNIFGFYSNS